MGAKSREITLAVIAVAIVSSAVALFVARSGGDEGPPTDFNFHGVCLACQEEVDAHASLRSPPPVKCPKCGEVAVYRLWYCEDCQNLYAMPIIRRDGEGRPRPARMPSCPGCGSGEAMGYPPMDPNGVEVKGRLPLPPWPPELPE